MQKVFGEAKSMCNLLNKKIIFLMILLGISCVYLNETGGSRSSSAGYGTIEKCAGILQLGEHCSHCQCAGNYTNRTIWSDTDGEIGTEIPPKDSK